MCLLKSCSYLLCKGGWYVNDLEIDWLLPLEESIQFQECWLSTLPHKYYCKKIKLFFIFTIAVQNATLDSDDDGFDEDVETPRSTRIMKPTDITCFLTTVDGQLYGRCAPDGKMILFIYFNCLNKGILVP